MLSRMTVDGKAIPNGAQTELNEDFERRTVDVFVWLLTDQTVADTP